MSYRMDVLGFVYIVNLDLSYFFLQQAFWFASSILTTRETDIEVYKPLPHMHTHAPVHTSFQSS